MAAPNIPEGLFTYLLSLFIEPLRRRIRVFRNLKENAELLDREGERLSCLKDDVYGELQECLHSDQHNSASNQVLNWFRNVEDFIGQSTDFSASFDSRAPSCSLPFSFRSNYKLAKRTVALLEQARELILSGKQFRDTNLLVIPASDDILLRLTKDAVSNKGAALKSLRDDLFATVQNILSQDARLERSNRLSNWFWYVEKLLESSSKFSESIATMAPLCRPLCKSTSSTSCGCSLLHELRVRETQFLHEANLLVEEGKGFTDDQMVMKAARAAMEEIPIYTEVVGQEGELSKTLDLINGDEADIIGIWGMGGVGKTTLLKNINNHMYGNMGNFDIVVWVSVHKDMNIKRIRGELGQKLGLSKKDADLIPDLIPHCFKNKSFLLLIDDVWDPLEFGEIGIPPLSIARNQKVVLTTRSREVCYAMHIKEENRVFVGPLTPEQSWKLFCLHVNNEDIVHDPSIEPLARDVANKCGGLPLALNVVGRAMAGARYDYQWRNAKVELEGSAHAFQGMDQVLSVLKFSYDRLENNAMREILLYCSLYPQGHNIFEEDLVGMLMEEGFFETINISRDHGRDRLRTWISRIINAGLLLCHMEDNVKLHDCVREMALWLTDGQFDELKLFVRWSPEESSEGFPRFLRGWEKAKRTSMVYSGLETISDDVQSPHCEELVTLLWEMGKIVRIPDDFFMHMTHLKVLNLSNSGIKVVPRSIVRLHHLKYLNLQSTPIKSLPEEIGDLEKLVQLILRYAHFLKDIPRKSISRLHKLERLDMFGINYIWVWREETDYQSTNLGLKDLEDLARNKLSDIGISLKLCVPLIRYFPNSANLTSSVTQLDLIEVNDYFFDHEEFPKRLSKRIQILHVNYGNKLTFKYEFSELRELSISEAQEVVIVKKISVFRVLSKLNLSYCSNLYRFRLASGLFPCLKVLRINNCYTIENLLVSENGFKSFPCLKELSISSCCRLRKISDIALELRSLEELYIFFCNELKKLPFNIRSAPRLRRIRGEAAWWDQLEWEEESVKSKFLPRFVARQ